MPETKEIRLLLIEDDEGDALLLKELLLGIGRVRLAGHVTSLGALRAAIITAEPDVILMDLGLPDGSGLDSLRSAVELADAVPIVVLTGLDDEEVALDALHNGAQDYLVKGTFGRDLLWRAIRYSIERNHMRRQLMELSLQDELTGLYNRRGFMMLASQSLKLADRAERGSVLIFVDLDGMKTINDRLGHKFGDMALRDTAGVLRETFRESDILARIGGDEFVVMAMAAGGENAALMLAHVTENVARLNAKSERPYKLCVSCGCASASDGSEARLEDMLVSADSLMYEEKQRRKKEGLCNPL